MVKSFDQGKIFNKNKQKIKKRTKQIKTTLKEGFDGTFQAYSTSHQAKIDLENEKIENLNQEFNTKLALYSKKYEEYLSDLLQNQDKAVHKYKNKVVKNMAGEYYYINNYGYKRKINDTTNVKCVASDPPTLTIQEDQELSKIGIDIQPGETCDDGGINIKDIKSGTYAWVNARGEKREYNNWDDKHAECSKFSVKSVDSSRYNTYKTNTSKMYSTDECGLNIDQSIEMELKLLNADLKRISNEIKAERDQRKSASKVVIKKTREYEGSIEKKSSDNIVDDTLQKKRSTLLSKITELKQEKQKFKDKIKNLESINGEFENNVLNADAEGIKHAMWGIGIIALGIAIYKGINSSSE